MMISILMTIHVFNSNVANKYTGEDATLEILLMLFASALLGFLLRHFLGYMSKKEIIIEADLLRSNHLQFLWSLPQFNFVLRAVRKLWSVRRTRCAQ